MNQLKSSGIKIRELPESNYRSIFINNKTIRQAIDPNKPITELRWPEFYDISMGSFCSGNCKSTCYASAKKNGTKYKNLAQKIHNFFGSMTENQRPYQVACGGEGDSTENEECYEAFKAFSDLGITPNVTTHGLFINHNTIAKLKESGVYCVAVSMHPHLNRVWDRAIRLLAEAKIPINIHFVYSDKESIDLLEKYYQKYVLEENLVDYFVLLPRMNVGYAAQNPKKVDLVELSKFTDKYHHDGKLAFGANAANWLFENAKKYKINMYPVEIFSKYLLLDESFSTMNNSFDRVPVNFVQNEGFELGKVRTDYSLI